MKIRHLPSIALATLSLAILGGCAAPVNLDHFVVLHPVSQAAGPTVAASPSPETTAPVNLIRRGPPPAPAPAPVLVDESAYLRQSVQFPFGGFSPQSSGPFDQIAQQALRLHTLKSVTITGYADSIGTPAENQRIALRRALVVKALLIARGVPADKIVVHSAGASDFLVSPAACRGSLHAREVCQAPNRRVVVEVQGSVQALIPGR